MRKLCVLLVVLLLAACSGSGSGTGATGGTGVAPTSTPIIAGGKPTPPPGGVEGEPTVTPVSGETATRTPTADEIAEQEYRRLKEGKLAFNAPEQMALGNVEKVRLRLTKDAGVTFATLAPEQEPGQALITGTLKVGTTMAAILAGDKFKITPLSSEEQLVLSEGVNEWAWYVEPLESGTHSLTLRVTVKIKVGDEEKARDFLAKEIAVQVKVNWLSSASKFVMDNWEKLLGLLIPSGALGGWLYQRLRKKRTSSQERS